MGLASAASAVAYAVVSNISAEKRGRHALPHTLGWASASPTALWWLAISEALLRRLDPPQPEHGLRRNNSDSFGRYGEPFAAPGPLLGLPIQDGLLP